MSAASICGDNRFELIAKAHAMLVEDTNIEDRPDEMAVLDSILFRCWQMGWLDRLGAGTCRRVRGHRSYRTQGGYRIECSECGYGLADKRYHYCPRCGRRIMEVDE